jgi:hypothetical protein
VGTWVLINEMWYNTSMAALHHEHSNIPTVFVMVSDPVGMHYVESFSRPGGNTTGFTPFEPTLGGKWVSLLKEVAPSVERRREVISRPWSSLPHSPMKFRISFGRFVDRNLGFRDAVAAATSDAARAGCRRCCGYKGPDKNAGVMTSTRLAWRQDIAAGAIASIVSLPVCVASGVLAFAPLGPGYAATGAGAGLCGAIVAGIVSALFATSSFVIASPR